MWLLVTIFSYLIFAVVSLVDRYLLKSSIPNPKVYVFYVGTLGILVLILAPFIGFYIPGFFQIILSLFCGMVFILGLFLFYRGLQIFEASRLMTAIGGLIPLFTFGLVYIFSLGKKIPSVLEGTAFILLILGSILIVFEKEKLITWKCFKFSVLVAFLFSLYFISSKYIYLGQSFWNGFFWIRIGGFLTAFGFLILFREIRGEIFRKKVVSQNKTLGIFISNQLAGGGASILQSWAVALSPLIYIPFINALAGIQYAFLLIFTILLSLKSPQFLKEEISKEILLQKIVAILLIGGGLALLAFK